MHDYKVVWESAPDLKVRIKMLLLLYALNLFYSCSSVDVPCSPTSKVLYDLIRGFDNMADKDPVAAAWQPLLNYHHTSCVSYPAVNAEGEITPDIRLIIGAISDGYHAQNIWDRNNGCITSPGQAYCERHFYDDR